jgi:hypothetical protein
MSRTYRSIIYWGWHNMTNTSESELYGYVNVKGAYWNWKKNVCTRFVIVEKAGYFSQKSEEPFNSGKNLCRINGIKLKTFRKRDKKPWHKPDKVCKQMRENSFRAQCKHELRTGRMDFPPYKKSDIWDWI